jgi:hypothetical protein
MNCYFDLGAEYLSQRISPSGGARQSVGISD